ncbi:hypothetical protein [Parasediminibacterium sp. JCM 36343]|uniref:hypothetical protein n=1 Tax=Parasediminibacterium sp. JCM 36343 TaxID=3374279 RepID=UPI003977EA7A
MTTIEAQKFGRTKVLIATVIVFIILVLLLFIGQVKGDFANGLLFFMSALLNIHCIAIFSILFGTTYLLGGRAGKEIIIDKKDSLLIAIKYAISISFLLSIYGIFIAFLREKNFSFIGLIAILKIHFFDLFFKMDISLLAIWFWATNKMKNYAEK